jgi:hypothetical protein
LNTHTNRKKRQICQVIIQGFSKEYRLTVATFYNKSLLQFIAILSNSRKNISYKIIFTFNMFYNQIVVLQH